MTLKLSSRKLPCVALTLMIATILLTLRPSISYSEEDPVVAIINDFKLLASDVNTQIAKMPLGDQVSVRSNPEKFAESLIQEEVLFQFILETDFSDEPELRSELKTIAVNHLIEKYVTQKMLVSREEIENYYNNNTSSIRGETVQVSHILTKTRAECEPLHRRLIEGEKFADLARQYSIHESSSAEGGELGSIMNHNGPLGFEPELFAIPQNQPEIFESSEGCHIAVVTGRDTPPLPPLEAVEPALENLLLRQKEIDALQALIENAHKHVEIVRPQQKQ